MFSCGFCEISKNIISAEHLQTTASACISVNIFFVHKFEGWFIKPVFVNSIKIYSSDIRQVFIFKRRSLLQYLGW